MLGQKPDDQGKCVCERCHKKMTQINFYTYKDGSKSEICKLCLTAYIDNFDKDTFEWILKKFDVPYIPSEWNSLRDAAFAKDPYKMNGMSVIGKYLGKMRLKRFLNYGYADSEKIIQQLEGKKNENKSQEQKEYEASLKRQLENGDISEAEYKTLVSTETQNEELPQWGDLIIGTHPGNEKKKKKAAAAAAPDNYEDALNSIKNPFQEQNFISQAELQVPEDALTKQDRIFLAMKWGRLYTPAQWIALEKLYKEFTDSFDIQGAARLDTLKMICKTSLKMNEAIDSGDIDAFQKLSRVYDSLMKSAKFTEAQKKEKEGEQFDSASVLVDFVEMHSGGIPRYVCKQPQDIVDQIILDLKTYNKNLIYEDKSLAQEIEKYLQQKRNVDEMKKDKKMARQMGLDQVILNEKDYVAYKEQVEEAKAHDEEIMKGVQK